ncbi:MAG: hypothetical protein HC872_07160 [Gammaproteobacteria bacterium]|nr:hypothetical protein [Gammaproteobacteria bacterium]
MFCWNIFQYILGLSLAMPSNPISQSSDSWLSDSQSVYFQQVDFQVLSGDRTQSHPQVLILGGSGRIGAAVALTDAMQVIVQHFPSLAELFLRFASPPIRNAG